MDWATKWPWILDAVVAVPGIRVTDLKWYAKQKGLGLWDTQINRALKAATTRQSLISLRETGYYPTYIGIALLDRYKHSRPSPLPMYRERPTRMPASFKAAGRSISLALEINYAFGEQTIESVRSLLSFQDVPRYHLLDCSPSLVLRGVLSSKLYESRPRNYYLSGTIGHRLISAMPIPSEWGWTEFWIEGTDDAGPVPILTFDSREQVERFLTLYRTVTSIFNYLVVLDPKLRAPQDLLDRLSPLALELVTLSDE